MIEFLTDNEKKVLNFYKEEYNIKHSDSLGYIQSQLEFPEDTLAALQSKGFLEIKRDDFGNNQEFVNVILKDKFFKYFNININQ